MTRITLRKQQTHDEIVAELQVADRRGEPMGIIHFHRALTPEQADDYRKAWAAHSRHSILVPAPDRRRTWFPFGRTTCL